MHRRDSTSESASDRAHSLWRRLVDPSPALTDVGDRASARLLASLLLVVVALGLTSAIGQQLTRPDFTTTFAIVLGSLILLGGTYAVSRSARYRVAAIAASLVPVAAGAVVGWVVPDDPVWFAFMTLGPVLASAFLSAGVVAAIGALTVAATALVLTTSRGATAADAIAVLSCSTVVAVLIAVVSRHRAAIERARQDEVRESQALYKVLFDHAPLGIGVTTGEGRLLIFNDALPALGGYTRDELQRLGSVSELYCDGDTRATLRARVERDGQVVAADVRITAKDGAPRDVSLSLVPLLFGGAQCYLAVAQDISARKHDDDEKARLSAELLAQQRRFASLLEYSSDLIVLIGADGTLRYANAALTTILGYPVDEWRGKNILGLVHPDDRAAAQAAFERSLASPGQIISGHLWLRHADGSARLLEGIGANHLDDPATNGIVINGRDVTARRQVDESIRQNEHRLRVAIDVADLGVFEMDTNLRYTWLYSPQLGYTPADMMGRTDEELVGQDGRTLTSIKRRVLVTGEHERHEVRVAVDGRDEWFDLAVEPVRSDTGAIVGLRGAFLRITHAKSLRDQLLHAQKMDTLGRLAGGIAHDFNNLLTVINGTAALAAADLRAEDRLHRDLESIVRAGERAAGLTRQLLAFSRKQVLQFAVVDLAATVASVTAMLRRVMGANITLTVVSADDLGSVRADPGQIEQVLVNLAVNARDAMPAGGTLAIETANVDVDDAHALLLAVAPGPYVRLCVRDTGAGMDQATRERIFEPFFTTKPVGSGTGLGLSTVYGIVKQSGGGLAVTSEPGQGCAFEIVLPRVEGHAPAERVDRPATARPGTETVLLVEDEPDIRALAERLLTSAGYSVIAAGSGPEALRLSERHAGPIDLVVADVVMPGMTGLEVAARLRESRPGVKVLYMSGFADDAVHAFEAGAHFIAKPFPMTELALRIRGVLDADRLS